MCKSVTWMTSASASKRTNDATTAHRLGGRGEGLTHPIDAPQNAGSGSPRRKNSRQKFLGRVGKHPTRTRSTFRTRQKVLNMTIVADRFYDDLATRLRAARKASGMTLQQVGQRSGLSVDHLSKIERLDRPLTLDHLRSIAAAINRPVTDFFSDTPPPAPPPSDNDPDRIWDQGERKLLEAFRNFRGKEKRFVMLIINSMREVRDRRFDNSGRKRPPNWPRPPELSAAPGPSGEAAAPSGGSASEGGPSGGSASGGGPSDGSTSQGAAGPGDGQAPHAPLAPGHGAATCPCLQCEAMRNERAGGGVFDKDDEDD